MSMDADFKMKATNSVGKWVNNDRINKFSPDPYPQHLNLSLTGKNLPKQLRELFTPLKCNLCKCTMSSIISAKSHYKGKKHIINIKRWVMDNNELNDGIINEEFHSKLNSDELHYESNATVKSGKQTESYTRMGVYSLFMETSNAIANVCPLLGNSQRNDEQELKVGVQLFNKYDRRKHVQRNEKFFCERCQVGCTSEITFGDHLAGSKHKKKIAMLTAINDAESSTETKDNILGDVIRSEKKFMSEADLSIYRTPSGRYYCHSCNVTVNSQIQFLQHSKSRKHKYKSSLKSSVRAYK